MVYKGEWSYLLKHFPKYYLLYPFIIKQINEDLLLPVVTLLSNYELCEVWSYYSQCEVVAFSGLLIIHTYIHTQVKITKLGNASCTFNLPHVSCLWF